MARSTGTVARAAAARGVKALRVGRDIVDSSWFGFSKLS